MFKTFYKARNRSPVLYRAELQVRSLAYGAEVHDRFVNWRMQYIEEWNKPRQSFLLLEGGDIGANSAKFDGTEAIRVESVRGKTAFTKERNTLHRLWFEGMLLDVNKIGDFTVNEKPGGFTLGTELKAWGASVEWDEYKRPTYRLFVVSKPTGEDDTFLSVYPVNRGSGPENRVITRVRLPSVLNARSYLYCYGDHVFLIHGGKLMYFYFRSDINALETVAIGENSPNDGKPCCNHVCAPVIADEQGNIYWQSENTVCSFPIGYPSRLRTIQYDEQFNVMGIQCYADMLLVYRLNKFNREFDCLKYLPDGEGGMTESVFNRGSVRNVFYYERNRNVSFVKIPYGSYRAFVARYSPQDGTETVVSDFAIDGEPQIFCTDGGIYIGYDYVGT